MRLICFTLVTGGSVGVVTAETANEPLRKACEYLWSQQAVDGGWHSEQYAMLRSGQALTPFVLHALLEAPESICPRPAGGVERALAFIRAHVDGQGRIGHSDPDIVEYPVYSTAYALECLIVAGGPGDYPLETRMRDWLEAAQYQEANGFERTHLAYGGWGFDVAKGPGDPGHMDLAHSRRALEAITKYWECGPGAFYCGMPFPVSRDRAQDLLRVVQKHPDAVARQPASDDGNGVVSRPPFDGGFYFSPVVLAANKGREDLGEDGTAHYRSYATATCDGILALLAAGVPRDDERVVRAIEWLQAHGDLGYPQGVPTDYSEPWGDAIRFYHYTVRAEAYAALDWPGDWRARLAPIVAKSQAADGSFRNTASPLMKEDDPLLCTALAVKALSHCAQ